MLAAARCRWPLARLTFAGRACSARGHTRKQVCSAAPPPKTLTFLSTHPQATSGLAELLASVARPGDVLLLHGNVGVGKSHFSRAFIRGAMGDPNLLVPSPTYLLQQTYDSPAGHPIHHFDLYRLTPGDELSLARLDLASACAEGVCLVEWPDRLSLAGATPEKPLHLSFALRDGCDPETQRVVQLVLPPGPRWEAVQACLAAAGNAAGLVALDTAES